MISDIYGSHVEQLFRVYICVAGKSNDLLVQFSDLGLFLKVWEPEISKHQCIPSLSHTFFTPPADGADFLAALVASCLKNSNHYSSAE